MGDFSSMSIHQIMYTSDKSAIFMADVNGGTKICIKISALSSKMSKMESGEPREVYMQRALHASFRTFVPEIFAHRVLNDSSEYDDLMDRLMGPPPALVWVWASAKHQNAMRIIETMRQEMPVSVIAMELLSPPFVTLNSISASREAFFKGSLHAASIMVECAVMENAFSYDYHLKNIMTLKDGSNTKIIDLECMMMANLPEDKMTLETAFETFFNSLNLDHKYKLFAIFEIGVGVANGSIKKSDFDRLKTTFLQNTLNCLANDPLTIHRTLMMIAFVDYIMNYSLYFRYDHLQCKSIMSQIYGDAGFSNHDEFLSIWTLSLPENRHDIVQKLEIVKAHIDRMRRPQSRPSVSVRSHPYHRKHANPKSAKPKSAKPMSSAPPCRECAMMGGVRKRTKKKHHKRNRK